VDDRLPDRTARLAKHARKLEQCQQELAVMRLAYENAVHHVQSVAPEPERDEELTYLRIRTQEMSVALERAHGALDFATMCHVETELRTARGLDKSEDALAFCHQRIDELEANETSLVARDASHARLIAARDSRLFKATSQIRSLQADVSNLVLDESRSGPAVRVRKQYGDLKSAAATASRRRMVNVATRQHTEELMARCKSTNVPINVSTRIDDRIAVVVDESGDGVATGAWNDAHGRWIYDDDGLPVMRALRVRDDANISNATSGKLAKCSMGVSPGQLTRAKAAFNKRLQRPIADGGHGVSIQSSDRPPPHQRLEQQSWSRCCPTSPHCSTMAR
jgi:hypothetical protein